MPPQHIREENRSVLAYLGQGLPAERVRCEPPGPEVDTWRLGAHPEVVQRLWDQLNSALEGDGRVLVADTAALRDPRSGVIVAVALGTQYALRLSGEQLRAALDAGHETMHEFRTVGRVLDLAVTFGPDWVFGRYHDREAEWLRASVEER